MIDDKTRRKAGPVITLAHAPGSMLHNLEKDR